MTTAERRVTDLDMRAALLRCIAEEWDSTIFRYDDLGWGSGAIDHLIDGMTATAMEYADVLMPRTTVREYMEELRDATNALRNYELNGISPVDDEDLAGYSDDMILALLNGDIDDALWPLLSGMSTANLCHECRRTHASVTTWRVREAGSSRCASHS